MQKVLHDVSARALQIHGSLGTTHEMPFVEYLVESFVLGLADGPTEVHKVTLARQVLKGYAPAPDLFPSEHLLRLKAAAEAKVADELAGSPASLTPSGCQPSSSRARSSRWGSMGAMVLDRGVGIGAAAVVLHDQRPGGRRLEAGERLEPPEVGDVTAQRVGVERRPARSATAAPSRSACRAGRSSGSALTRNQPTSTRGSPSVQISQSTTAVMSAPAASRLPSRKSPCTTATGTAVGARARRCAATSLPTGHQGRVDRVQQPAPPVDLLVAPDHGLAAEPDRLGVEGVHRREHARGVAHPLGDDGLVVVVAVVGVEQRLQRRSLDERHHEQRRHLRRIAGVFPQHLGTGDRGAVQRAAAAGPGATRRGSGPAPPRRARP